MGRRNEKLCPQFRRWCKKGSVKNFILQDVSRPNYPRVFFGKMDEDEFRLDISTSLAPLVGFGIALSTFGGEKLDPYELIYCLNRKIFNFRILKIKLDL